MDIEQELKNAIKDPQGFISRGNDLLESLNPELRADAEKQARAIAAGPLGNELRRKLQQQGMNRRKFKQMQRTNKALVKGKKDEEVERGIIITQSRNLKTFNIFRSKENECICNAINGLPVTLPLFQRLQGTEWASKGVKIAYNPRGLKINRRAKKFLGPKAQIRGDVAVFLETGSLNVKQLEEIEKHMISANQLTHREEEVKESQAMARKAGMGEGLLPGEKAIFGEKEEAVDYGDDDQYLQSDDEDNVVIDDEKSESNDSDIEDVDLKI